MLFIAIRLIFLGLVFIAFFLLIRKSHIIYKKRWRIISLILAIAFTAISALIPIENAFITFSTVEASYSYSNFGTVKLIVDGEKTDFVISQKGDTDIYTIIPKSNDGWKLGVGLDIKKVIQMISDGITIDVYQYKNSGDYYITVLDTNGGESEISDNHNSEFHYLEKTNSALNKIFYTYYAYVDDFSSDYTVTVNGKSIRVQN